MNGSRHTQHMERPMQADLNHGEKTASFFVGLDFPPDPLANLFLWFRGRRHHNAIVASFFQAFIPLVQSFGFARQKNRTSSLLEKQHDQYDLHQEEWSAIFSELNLHQSYHDAVENHLMPKDPSLKSQLSNTNWCFGPPTISKSSDTQ